MMYSVSKKDFSNKQLVFKYLDGYYDTSSKELIIEEEKFFNDFKERIKNLNIKSLTVSGNKFYYKAVIKNENDFDDYVIYNLSDNNKENINEYRLKNIYDYYLFDEDLINNNNFKEKLYSLADLYKKYEDESRKKIEKLEQNDKIVRHVFSNACKLYKFFKDNDNCNQDLELKKDEIINTYQFICDNDYIKECIKSECNNYNLVLFFGFITTPFIGPLINAIINDATNNPVLATALGAILTITIPALCIKSLDIKDDMIEKRSEIILQNIKNYLESNYNLCDKDNNIKTLKKSI